MPLVAHTLYLDRRHMPVRCVAAVVSLHCDGVKLAKVGAWQNDCVIGVTFHAAVVTAIHRGRRGTVLTRDSERYIRVSAGHRESLVVTVSP